MISYHTMGQPLQHIEPSLYSRCEVFQFLDSVHRDRRRALVLELPAIHVAFVPNVYDPFPIRAQAFVYIKFDDERFRLRKEKREKKLNVGLMALLKTSFYI